MIIAFKSTFPSGTQADWWVGRQKAWDPNLEGFQGSAPLPDGSPKPFALPPMAVTASMRYFHLGYIPRGTTDRVFLRFRAPQQATRFAVYDLGPDLRHGLVGPHRRMLVRIPFNWDKLSQDAAHPTRLQ